MKTFYSLIIFCSIALSLVLTGCASTGEGMSNDRNQEEGTTIPERYSDMLVAEYLDQIGGVRVSGYQVIISGVNNVGTYSPPLFVVDGKPVGRNFGEVAYMSMKVVESIEIIKGARASVYGTQGGGGVILIVTRTQ